MRTLDVRSRADAGVTHVAVDTFCRETLPALLDVNGPLAARGLARLGLRPLSLVVDDHAFTLRATDRTITAEPGVASDAAVAKIDAAAFSDLVQELRTATAFLTAGDVEMLAGSIFEFVEWDPVLRAIIDGRPVHEPGMVTFKDVDGDDLDLHRSFAPGDDDAEIAHFLAEAGFLHLKGWLDPGLMERIADDIDRALPTYAPGDGRSWWARTADGTDRCVRLQHFIDHSPATAELLDEAEYLRIAGFGGAGHRRGPLEGNIIEALVKPIGVVEGISDVPWHMDCALGRHPYECCGMTVGISVTGSDADTGQLCVVAGSHRASMRKMGLRDDADLPVIPLPTEPGDLTVHLSCTLHMAMPPRTAERKVMYSGFGLPPRAGDTGVGRDRIMQIREGAPATVSQEPGYVP